MNQPIKQIFKKKYIFRSLKLLILYRNFIWFHKNFHLISKFSFIYIMIPLLQMILNLIGFLWARIINSDIWPTNYISNCSFFRFKDARTKISLKYDEIERSLIEEFVKSHRVHETTRMKEIANILMHFKSYSQCIDAFIEESQMVIS